MSGVFKDCYRNSQKLKKTVLRLHYACIVRALLEIHLNSFDSHSAVAFSRFEVRMQISVQRGLSGFHKKNAKDALSRSGIHV